MKNKLSEILSIAGLTLFILIAFGSMDDDKQDKNQDTNTKVNIESYNHLTQVQKDSLLKAEAVKKIEARENQTILAKDLYYAYSENEVKADNIYNGKRFYVEGTIHDIGKDFLNEIYITLKTNDIIGSVQCYIDDADIVSNLKKGQKITVYGTCDGLLMNVLMKDCIIVENLSDLKNE